MLYSVTWHRHYASVHKVPRYTRICNSIYAFTETKAFHNPIYTHLAHKCSAALRTYLWRRIGPKSEKKRGKFGQIFIYTPKHSMDFTKTDFHETHNFSAALSEDRLCRISHKSDNKCGQKLI
jgi:hypothetical protein